MELKAAALALLGVLAGAAGLEAADDPVLASVRREIRQCEHISPRDEIRAAVRRGIVTLTGRVAEPRARTDLERRLAALNGVRQVRNQLEVLPASRADERIRHRVARAIYAHPAFWEYAAMPDPSIRVVVDGEGVRLTGAVRSRTEAALARALAARASDRPVVSELRVEAK